MKKPEQNKTNILFLNMTTWLGGGEYEVYYIVKNLDRSRFHPIMVFNGDGQFVEKMQSLGVEILKIPFVTTERFRLVFPTNLLKNFKASWIIFKIVKKLNIEIVQCSEVLAILLLIPSMVFTRIRVLYTVISVYEGLRLKLFNILAIMFLRKIIVHSVAMREVLLRRTVGLTKKVSVIYLGVDKTIFYPRTEIQRKVNRQELELPLDKKIVGFIGRYELCKGHSIFLKAAKILLTEQSDLIFLMVGGAPTAIVDPKVLQYKQQVHNLLKELEIEKNFIIMGHRNDIPVILSCIDVLVFPSDFEPFGLIAIEAFACGIPVVLSTTVGVLEVLNHADGVFVSQPNSVESFVDGIKKGLAYSRTYSTSSSFSKIVSTWSWEKCTHQFEIQYKKLLYRNVFND